MSDRLRVFILGAVTEDVESLRERLKSDTRLDVVGTGLMPPGRGTPTIPPLVDALIMTPGAWRRTAPPPPSETAPALVEQLTSREREVLALVADGHSNRDIATELDISEHTVKFHLASVFGKLGASSRTEAVRLGFRLGLIQI